MSGLRRARAAVASHPKLRAVAGAVVDLLVGASRSAPPGLRGGSSGAAEDDLQTVVVAIVGADADAVAITLDDLHAVADRHGALRVVVAVEGQHLTAVRRAGLAAEHLVSASEWDERLGPWSDYLRERLDTSRVDYAADAVLVLGPHGTAGLPPELVAAAVPRPPGRIARWFRVRIAALERALDAPTG